MKYKLMCLVAFSYEVDDDERTLEEVIESDQDIFNSHRDELWEELREAEDVEVRIVSPSRKGNRHGN